MMWILSGCARRPKQDDALGLPSRRPPPEVATSLTRAPPPSPSAPGLISAPRRSGQPGTPRVSHTRPIRHPPDGGPAPASSLANWAFTNHGSPARPEGPGVRSCGGATP